MDYGSIFMKIYVTHRLSNKSFPTFRFEQKIIENFAHSGDQMKILSLGSKSIEIRCNLLAFLLSDNDEIVLFFPLHSQIVINQANIERESRYGTCHSRLNATTATQAASQNVDLELLIALRGDINPSHKKKMHIKMRFDHEIACYVIYVRVEVELQQLQKKIKEIQMAAASNCN